MVIVTIVSTDNGFGDLGSNSGLACSIKLHIIYLTTGKWLKRSNSDHEKPGSTLVLCFIQFPMVDLPEKEHGSVSPRMQQTWKVPEHHIMG